MDNKMEEQKSQGSAPQSAANSTQKKVRKGMRKQNQETTSFLQDLNENAEKFNMMTEKYKDISGACDWFQHRKHEVESTQKKVNLSSAQYGGLPVSHQWKPPRVDQDKYQVGQGSIATGQELINTYTQMEKPDRQDSIVQSKLGAKRKTRSYSYDSDNDFKAPRKRVLYNGEQLLPSEPENQGPSKAAVLKPQLVYEQDKADNQDEKLQDYLELADFIMKETHNPHCNGMWLKGSLSGYQEKALKLLHSYKHNYNLAKFHILYPTVMAIPEQREEILNSLTDKELESIVADAIIDMRGCKSQEAEEAIQTIRNDMATNRITVEELGHYQLMLTKLRVELPDDIRAEEQRCREFSKTIKKKCGPQTGGGAAAQIPNEKKMKLTELLAMQDESLNYPIITAEMQQLLENVKKALQWKEKVEQLKSYVCQVKQLQSILSDARSIPVNFEDLYEDLKKRCNDSHILVEKIHAQFVKVNRTRTQITQEHGKDEKSKKKLEVNHHHHQHHKKERKHKEQIFIDLLKEADILLITSTDIQKLRDHIEEVTNWKRRAEMFLNDDRGQKAHKETFISLIKETLLFKFEVDLTSDLQKRMEFLDWLGKIEDIDARLNGKVVIHEDQEEMKDFQLIYMLNVMEDTDEAQNFQVVTLEDLQKVMQEGEKKGFSDLQIDIIQKVADICLRANKFENEMRKILKDIKDQSMPGKDLKQKVSIDKLVEMQVKSKDIKVQIPETQELLSIINQVTNYDNQCHIFIEKFNTLKDNYENQPVKNSEQQQLLKQLLEKRVEINSLGVQNETFKKMKILAQPILRWINHARLLVKTYLKSVQSEYPQNFSSLHLLEQQDYNSDSSSEEEEEDEDNVHMKNNLGSQKLQMPNQDDELLKMILYQAETEHLVLRQTLDYRILRQIQTKVDDWVKRVSELNEGKGSEPLNSQEDGQEKIADLVDKLEKLAIEFLPIPPNMLSKVQKQLRREKWLKRVRELFASEKVKIKQVETLAKEGNHSDIQEDQKCQSIAEDLKQQLIRCKEWMQLQAESDASKQKDIQRLLEQGKLLKINLVDFVELRTFNHQVVDWKEKSYRILNELKNPEFNYEEVRKHIEIGQELDINDKDIDALQAIVNMCAHWKSLARKILNSRELAKLDVQPCEIELNQAEALNAYEQQEQIQVLLHKGQDGYYQLIEEINTLSQRPTTAQKEPIQSFKNKVQYFDNQQYCICRRGDDGFGFMIECDSCKEWFHGDCVGISKLLGNKINQYVCIGCARVNFNFDPWNYQQQLQIQSQQKEDQALIEYSNLSAFTSLKRAPFEDLSALIVQGQMDIPIYLEEMNELMQYQAKINDWLANIQMIKDDPPIEVDEELIISQSEDKVFNYTQPNQKKGLDKVIVDMMKFYLESESFPVEHSDGEVLVLYMKQRKWFLESQKVLQQNQSANKNSKALLKKQAKRLITQFNELRIAHYPNLCQLQRDLQWLQQTQNQPNLNQQHQSQQNNYSQIQNFSPTVPPRNQMIQIQGAKKNKTQKLTNERGWQPEDFPENDSYIQRTLNKMFSGENLQYSECISFIEEAEGNNMFEIEADKEHIQHLKDFLQDFIKWLNEDFIALMMEGEQLFPTMKSSERDLYERMRTNYQSWSQNCLNILDQIEQHEKFQGLLSNPERLRYFIQALEKRYDQIALELNNLEQPLLQQQLPNPEDLLQPVHDSFALLQRDVIDHNNTLSKDNIMHNEGSHDIFK